MRHVLSVAAQAAVRCASAVLVLGAVSAFAPARAGEPIPAHTATRPSLHMNALPDFRASLDDGDETATLDAIHVALTQVGDGGSYVWHRNHGRLSGVFQPTQSFKDAGGQVCRHLVIMLVAGAAVRKAEGVACRLANGRWQLDG